MVMLSKFPQTSWYKWIDHKIFDLKLTWICELEVLEVDLEYPKELNELHNDYCLPLDKIEIEKVFCPLIN